MVKYKIAIISPKDMNLYKFRKELIEELVNKGYDVVLICPYGKMLDGFIELGCRNIDISIDRRGISIISDFLLLKNYYRILKKEKPNIVLTYTTKCSIYGGLVCRMLKIKSIINNSGLLDAQCYPRYLKFALNILYRIGFKKASCMMYQNYYERDYLNNILRNKVRYVDIPGSGINLHEFKYVEYPSEDEPIVFNFVGRLVNIKGIDLFIECAKEVKNIYPNTKFKIYGDYDDASYLGIIEELEKNEIVEYMGLVSDMHDPIRESSAFIHPSFYEGMTNVVLEHSAMGRVCIGSDIPGVREGIEDGVTGYTFPCKDVDALVATVKKFIELPHEQKEAMGRAARKKVEMEFDRNIVTNIYLNEIGKILSEG